MVKAQGIEGLSPHDRGVREQPPDCTPCGERQSSHSEQERGQAAAVTLLNTGYKVQPLGK